MKKILLILLIGIMTSCVYQKVDGNTKIPQKIIGATYTEQPDTLIFISDSEYHYYFNEINGLWVLKEKYMVNTDDVGFHFSWLILIFFVGFVVGEILLIKINSV